MATYGVDEGRENEEFDQKHPGLRKKQIMASRKRKESLAKKIKISVHKTPEQIGHTIEDHKGRVLKKYEPK